MSYKKSGEFISKCRKEMNLTQEELGRKLNYSRNNVSKWETGQSFPDPTTLTNLAEILDVSVEEILYGEIKTKKNNQAIIDNLVNEYKDKYNEFRKSNIMFSISMIVIIILFFSLIYFVFIRGTISVYKLSIDNEQFYMEDSMLLISNDISTLNLNEIKSKNNEKIINIRLYYLYKGNERLILSGENDDYFIEEENLYNEYLLKEIKNSKMFIDITTEVSTYKKIEINVENKFINTKILPKKNIPIGSDVNSDLQDFSDNSILLNYGFTTDDNVYYAKTINENVNIIVNENNIHLTMFDEKNDTIETLDGWIDSNQFLYDKTKQGKSIESSTIITERELDCEKKQCLNINNYAEYLNYLRLLLKK